MSCCITYDEALAKIEEIATKYHPNDYKIFVAKREGKGIIRKTQIGLVVKPNDIKNTSMFEELMSLQNFADTSCIKLLYSQIDLRDTRMVDFFLLEIETEVE